MIASLPMYDHPENRASYDALWTDIRERLGFGPRQLDRSIGYLDAWARDDLLLGHICNLPYRARFAPHLTRIGASDYGLPDTPKGYYHSVFVVRRDDAIRGFAPACLGTFAYNDALSQSGWGAPYATAKAAGLAFRDTVQTGSHMESARAVVTGRADLAAIDVVTWRHLTRWEPWTHVLSVIGRTGLSPGMTFVTAKSNDPGPIFNAVSAAISALSAEHQRILGLRGIVVLPDDAYDLPLPPAPRGQKPVHDTLDSSLHSG